MVPPYPVVLLVSAMDSWAQVKICSLLLKRIALFAIISAQQNES